MLHLQGVDTVEEFLPLKLKSFDVILWIQWLETLGMTYTDWKTKMMTFFVKQDGDSPRRLIIKEDIGLAQDNVEDHSQRKKGILVEMNHLDWNTMLIIVPEGLIVV